MNPYDILYIPWIDNHQILNGNLQLEKLQDGKLVWVLPLTDPFDDIDHPQLIELFRLTQQYPTVHWLIITRHIEKAEAFFDGLTQDDRWQWLVGIEEGEFQFPLSNIWLGISISKEDDLNGLVNLFRLPVGKKVVVLNKLTTPLTLPSDLKPDWVIMGNDTNPLHPMWVQQVRDYCLSHHIPFYFRGWGKWLPKLQGDYEFKDGRYRTKETYHRFGVISYNGQFFEDTTTWNGRQLDKRDDYETTMLEVEHAGNLVDGVKHEARP